MGDKTAIRATRTILDGLECLEFRDESGSLVLSAFDVDSICEDAARYACFLSNLEHGAVDNESFWSVGAIVYCLILSMSWEKELEALFDAMWRGSDPIPRDIAEKATEAFKAGAAECRKHNARLTDGNTWQTIESKTSRIVPQAIQLAFTKYLDDVASNDNESNGPECGPDPFEF